MKRLVLLDSHAIIHRAWHALPPLTSPDGKPVNAVYGFASILLKILKELKPDYAVAAFDHAGPTFRHLAFERYKAGRAKAPEALYQQIPLVKELVRAFGIPVVEKQGYEADDIIGTIVTRVGRAHPDVETIIVTGDLDTLQLVDSRAKVFTMKKGITDTVLYDAARVRERYGLVPQQLIDFRGLRGDPSDNIPGVKGIGEKGAIELLKRYGSIEKIYQSLKKNALDVKPAVKEILKAHEADALFSKTLATIDRDVPIQFVLASARLRKTASRDRARAALSELGFPSLVKRLGGERAAGSMPSTAPPLPVEQAPEANAVESFSRLSGTDHALVLPLLEQQKIAIATNEARVFALPVRALAASAASRWFNRGATTYVFDIKLLLGAGLRGDAIAKSRDLMVMWWLLDPGRGRYEPNALVRKELRVEPPDFASLTRALFTLAPVLDERLRAEELVSVYEEIEAPVTPILYRMEHAGIGFDARPLLALSRKLARALPELEERIATAAGAPFNVNSPRQLSEVLFEKLKLVPKGIRRTVKSGALSTRESELMKLRDAHPIVDWILRYREIAKLKSTYVDMLPTLVAADGRVHTTWNQTGTATGRLSSANPNLQNIPIRSPHGREIRKAFVAVEGFTFVAFDYSQLELRIAADLANDEKMMAAFTKGLDIHKLTAAEVHNVAIDNVTPALRSQAKTLNFGVLYGMGPRAFSETAGVSRDEAEHFIEEYFRDFSGIARFIEEQKSSARSQGFTKTAFGRKRFFPDIAATNFRLQREAERMAVNHPIQGTEADIMKKAMIGADRLIQAQHWEDRVRLLLQIHDELIFEIGEDVAPVAVPAIRKVMEGIWRGRVKMTVEVKEGQNWGALA